MSTLDGHTTLITGAGGGVGRGIALACARAGARVVLAVRRIETGEAVAKRWQTRSPPPEAMP